MRLPSLLFSNRLDGVLLTSLFGELIEQKQPKALSHRNQMDFSAGVNENSLSLVLTASGFAVSGTLPGNSGVSLW